MIRTVNMVVDPTAKYGEHQRRRLVEAAGIIPQFVLGTKETMTENMEDNYVFFDSWYENEASVDSDGMFHYPGDPAIAPLIRITREGSDETVYIYQHAIVAVVAGGKMKWTRMD